VLSDPAIERISEANVREVVLTDTVPLPPFKRLSKITTISVAPLFGEAIRRINEGESVGALFTSELRLVQEMSLWQDGVPRTMDQAADERPAADGVGDGAAAERQPVATGEPVLE
jgi:hypothetical protein